ncbi:Y-family DNA polymerase, partial [Azospirillum sp. B4]|uniref:Y-family DNA polymerase n=1 Tax=Azospirillum sp. B4 TaxID=95605 RepID=UPI0005CB1FC9
MAIFALHDSQNFYASCHKVFDPSLQGRPVIVLSNGDGCVVARSQEAKALGIPMGQPFFQLKDLARRERVRVFSSNYALYGDMSDRVAETLSQVSGRMERYSIDESFLVLDGLGDRARQEAGREMRDLVLRWTGIPGRVGIGSTKTLAKLANDLAKKLPGGVLQLVTEEQLATHLPAVPVGDLWGVGAATARRLEALGITTVAELRAMDRRRARQALGVVGQRIVDELNGTSCLAWRRWRRPGRGG